MKIVIFFFFEPFIEFVKVIFECIAKHLMSPPIATKMIQVLYHTTTTDKKWWKRDSCGSNNDNDNCNNDDDEEDKSAL